MSKTIVIAAMAALVLTAGVLPAAAADNRTLGEFLSDCKRHSDQCRLSVTDYLQAAVSQKMACLPEDRRMRYAVEDVIDAMRKVGDSDPKALEGNAEDVEWNAISTMFPCTPAPDQAQQPAP